MISKSSTAAVTVLASTFLAVAPAPAVVIGTPATGGNYIPFGSMAGYPEYQQVYGSSDFSGPITIDTIEFYTVAGSTGKPNTGTIEITLSTTKAAANGLNTNLSKNFGPSKTVVYDAKISSVVNGVLTIDLSKAFTYNPANGNLLIDIDDEKTP